jgi:hypothetical protein
LKAHIVFRKAKEFVLNEHFWECCTNFRELMAMVMWALWDFDGKDKYMETILHIFRNLE